MFVCLISGDIDLDHLVKVISTRFSHSFPFVINKYPGGDI